MRRAIATIVLVLALASASTFAVEVDAGRYRVLPVEDKTSDVVWWKSVAIRCDRGGRSCPHLDDSPHLWMYFEVKGEKVLPLRLKASRWGSKWIFVNSLALKIDGRLYTVPVPFTGWRRTMTLGIGRLDEDVDIIPSAKVTEALCKARQIKVRFSGTDGHGDYDIPPEYVWTIRETCRLQKSAAARKRAVASEPIRAFTGNVENGDYDDEGKGGVVGEEAPLYMTAGFRKPQEVQPGCVRSSMRVPPSLAGFISGPITVKFAVRRDGSIGQVQIMSQDSDPRITEVIRQGLSACQWTPGADAQGRPVSIWVIMPIRFAGG